MYHPCHTAGIFMCAKVNHRHGDACQTPCSTQLVIIGQEGFYGQPAHLACAFLCSISASTLLLGGLATQLVSDWDRGLDFAIGLRHIAQALID